MSSIVSLGIDLAKNVFALHGVDGAGTPVLVRPNVPRSALVEAVCFLVAGEQGFRAACHLPASTSPQTSGLAGMMARASLPKSLIRVCNRSRLPGLKQKRQQDENPESHTVEREIHTTLPSGVDRGVHTRIVR